MKGSGQRVLVALLVLVLTGAIIWPLWQREDMTVTRPLALTLPDEPELPAMDTAPPVTEREMRAVAARIQEAREQAAQQRAAGDHSLPLPEAWAVPVSRWPDESAARNARQMLLDTGYRAFVREHGDHWQLYAGPELDRARAEQTRERLLFERKVAPDVTVVPFSP